MANNNFEAWKDEYVAICNDRHCSCQVRFGDLLPFLLQKMDVFEYVDFQTYDHPCLFVSAYYTAFYNMGYGDFNPPLGY